MKVYELIDSLKQLDQDRNIWILYDCCYPQEPVFEPAGDCTDDNSKIKESDYIHKAW